MSKSLLAALLCALLQASSMAAGAESPSAGRPPLAIQRQGDDQLVCGGTPALRDAVAGDTLALGGKVRLGGDVGRSVYAAAGQLSVAGKVGRVSIDGPVGGDVTVTAGQVELGPRASIAGKLRYGSREPLVRDAAAEVAGGVEAMAMPMNGGAAGDMAWHDHATRGFASAWSVTWTLGLVLLLALLLAALPGPCAAVARTLRERPGASLLLGFVWLVCVPVAAVLMAVTVIGSLFGLLALLAGLGALLLQIRQAAT